MNRFQYIENVELFEDEIRPRAMMRPTVVKRGAINAT